MLRHWPALDVPDADDLLLAVLDDHAPTAIEERAGGVRIFFATREHRDAALAALTRRQSPSIAIDVSDEDWAVFSNNLDYVPLAAGAEALKSAVEKAEKAFEGESRRLHYLSVPPSAALSAVR